MSFEERAATMSREDVAAMLASNERLTARIEELRRQLEWLKRQLFGAKSERRLPDPDSRQLALGEWANDATPASEVTIAEHRRRQRRDRADDELDAEKLRFSDDVPVEEIRVDPPDMHDGDEIISEKVTYRLAQKPASYVVIKTIRPVVKRRDGSLSCAPAPSGVLGKSIADVSLLANLAVEKFVYHLPLYRQHQRMAAAGVRLARSTLTGLVHRTAELLEPIAEAQLASVLASSVLVIDETPIKAGRKEKGRMKTCYFWPILGDRDEIVFPFSESRSGTLIAELLDGFEGAAVTDGYRVYEVDFAARKGIAHGQCWAHARRQFLAAEGVEPELVAEALERIRLLYRAERHVNLRIDDGATILEKRARFAKPIVDGFFAWLEQTLNTHALLPRNPFTEAANYALHRKDGLRVFLQHPGVPLDTSAVEREIRPVAIGRKNWLFCWTEIGAKYVGIFHSLLRTCRLQGIDPYSYLVDVLLRIDTHPASDVAALTPRLWKERFASNPLRSLVDRTGYAGS